MLFFLLWLKICNKKDFLVLEKKIWTNLWEAGRRHIKHKFDLDIFLDWKNLFFCKLLKFVCCLFFWGEHDEHMKFCMRLAFCHHLFHFFSLSLSRIYQRSVLGQSVAWGEHCGNCNPQTEIDTLCFSQKFYINRMF